MTYSMKEAIRIAVLTKEANSWPTFDGGNLKRSENVTASEATTCVRRLAFQKNEEAKAVPVQSYWGNMDPNEFYARLDLLRDDSKEGIFERGHNVEAWAVSQLLEMRQEDEEFLFVGQCQVSFYLVDSHVSGTPDGIYVNHSEQTWQILEFKSSVNRVTSPRDYHTSQVLVNMGIVKSLLDREWLDVSFVGYEMEPGLLLYIDPSNYLTMDEFEVTWDGGAALEQAKAKARALFRKDGLQTICNSPDTLAPEGLSKVGGCMFCDYKAQCYDIEARLKHKATSEKLRALLEGNGKSVPKMPTFGTDTPREQVLRIIADYDAFNKAEKDAKAHKDALKESIASWVKSQEGMIATFEDNGRLFRVSLSQSERAGGVDTDKLGKYLADKNEDLDNFRKGPSKVETLLVSVKAAK